MPPVIASSVHCRVGRDAACLADRRRGRLDRGMPSAARARSNSEHVVNELSATAKAGLGHAESYFMAVFLALGVLWGSALLTRRILRRRPAPPGTQAEAALASRS